MSPFTVDGILYVPPTEGTEPSKPADEFRSTGETSAVVLIAEIAALAAASIAVTVADRVLPKLTKAVVYAVTLLVSLPYGLAELAEKWRGEHRG